MKKEKIINFFIFLSLFLIFLLPPIDPDLGWHLRCGEEFWQKHSLCSKNHFSLLLPDYHWPNHYWLYQAILFLIYKFGGLWGLAVFNALLITGALFFFFETLSQNLEKKWPYLSVLAIGFLILSAWDVLSLGIRSQLTGLFFFSLIFYLSNKFRQSKSLGIYYSFLFLLWANTHGGSVILGLILLFFLFLSINTTRSRSPKRPSSLVLIYLLTIVATLVNPFGIEIYKEAFRHFAGTIDLSKLIAEWVPPNPLPWGIIFLSGTTWLTLALFWKRKTEKIVVALLVLSFMLLALRARRNVPFYFLIFFYFSSQSKTVKNFFENHLKDYYWGDELKFLIISFLFFSGIIFRLPLTIHALSSWENFSQASKLNYPLEAVKFLKTQKPANLFNRYEWGGFLIWQLPEFKIFVDGRMPAWPVYQDPHTDQPTSPYTIYLETLQTKPGWQETLSRYNIKWILISPGTFMDLLLKKNPQEFGWEKVYEDRNSVIYKKI